MTTKTIYIYVGENGSIQTPVKLPMTENKTMTRLIADDGKVLQNKNDTTMTTTCIDVENNEVSNWTEIDEPKHDVPNVQ